MACLDCLEKRGKVLRAMGLGRFAPDMTKHQQRQAVNGIAPVAQVDPRAAVGEVDAPDPIRAQFARYISVSDGATVKDITFAAAHLITYALGVACSEKKCADDQIEAVCEMIGRVTRQKYDAETGKRREIVMAQLLPF